MPSDPARDLTRMGAHLTTELVITALQSEAHHKFDGAGSAEGWSPLQRSLGHAVILGLAVAGRSVIHGGIDAALAPTGAQ
jgi:hypothetical protein